MAFNEQEKQIIIYGKANGKSQQEVQNALVRYRTGAGPVKTTPAPTEKPAESSGSVLDAAKGLSEKQGKIADDFVNNAAQINKESQEKNKRVDEISGGESNPATAAAKAGNFSGMLAKQAGNAINAVTQIGLSYIPDSVKTGIKDIVSKIFSPAKSENISDAMGQGINALDKFAKQYPIIADQVGNLKDVLLNLGLPEKVLPPIATIANETGTAARQGIDTAIDTAKSTVDEIANIPKTAIDAVKKNLPGTTQTATDLAERVPRFIGKVKEASEAAKAKGELIKSSEPPVANAIKSGVDQRVINTVTQADDATRKAYKEMVDIAEDAVNKDKGTLKLKQRPEIIAGNAVENQYKLIDAQKKKIGAELGAEIDQLSKTTKVDIGDGIRNVDDVLGENGVRAIDGKLDFQKSKFTPNERAAIQKLYELANEGSDSLTPRQIHGKDQLFSKLQREARFDGVGDLMIETPQGKMSLFRVFRDTFSNKLDEISSEKIRGLNKKYRNIITLTDDVEDTIIKSGKFETTKNLSDAQFAQTNLRRLLSDAQSAADYRGIVAELDKVSRDLGYTGANAEDLITFATELRKIYPETIPATSLGGTFKTSISGMVEKVLEAGKPGTADQQRALKALIESLLKKNE